jgi:hypothetical protein
VISEPAQLDLDLDVAMCYANRLEIPFVRPATHSAPVPRAMRLAALACQRSRGAIWTVRATHLAWATGPTWVASARICALKTKAPRMISRRGLDAISAALADSGMHLPVA